MIIIFVVLNILIIGVIIGKISLNFFFRWEVRNLFSQSRKITEKFFRLKQLLELPEPAQRYFKHVLKEGQPYISFARITHIGQFKTDLNKA